MKITNIGGATAILEHKGKRMLFDPWLNEGIFHGSWYHYPPSKVGIQDLGRLDYIYISHIHEDHCAPGTLVHLNRDAEVIIADKKPNYVKKFLEAYEFEFKKIHLVKPYTPTILADGMTADVVEDNPEHELNYLIDSGLVLKWDNFVIYNANDCSPYQGSMDYILKTYGQVDLALLPYAGGSSYPPCYVNLTHEEKMKEKQRIFESELQKFVSAVKILNPRCVMPFADQYVIAGSRSSLNRYMPHPPSPGIVKEALEMAEVQANLLLLNSAQSFDFDRKKKNPDEPYHQHTEEEKEQYIRENLPDKKYDHEAFDLDRRVSFDRLVQTARNRLWEMQQRSNFFPDFHYYLTIPDRKQRFQINLKKQEIAILKPDSPLQEPFIEVAGPATLMALLLVGHISWNIADAALFLDYNRRPNLFDPKLQAYLNHIRI